MGLREEILLDVQTMQGQGGLTAFQQRVLELLTKAAAGSMIAWGALMEIRSEIKKYQDRRGD